MLVFVCSVIIMGLVVSGMAVGVLAGRAPLKGSCGGLGAAGIDQSCEICGGNPARCDEESSGGERKGTASFYDASGR
jgi:hypothetical protein